ncbi:MAG: YlzJ-like family protein [Firmicutes bacterium]|jgi:hypothetical protein|nr:YlzJ-like family protein [Bacillota bacterium]MDD4336082.1 YlzJ-like family protein [Bacillota bacterium]MDD4792510.1 YlzJ-like family protein [Bacillota bacterium]
MLYTIMPIEDVLGEPPWKRHPYAAWRGPAEPVLGPVSTGETAMPIECNVNGVRLMVWPMPDGKGRVERIISTNPAHYLNPATAPGSLVDMRARL